VAAVGGYLMGMDPVVAHAGHWLAEVLYLVPVFVVVTWISVRALLEQRRSRTRGSAGPAPAPPE
jgi:hypothetical protein